MTYKVEILNPKVENLLLTLADLDLISIREIKEDEGFLKVVRKLRKKAAKNPPILEEITKEVEIVRAKRYVSKKR